MRKLTLALKVAFLFCWTLYCIIGIAKNAFHYTFWDYVIVLLMTALPYIILFLLSKAKKRHIIANEKERIVEDIQLPKTNDNVYPAYVEFDGSIQRCDGENITKEEIPYLIQVGYEKACKEFNKTRRTFEDEELLYRFEEKHSGEIQKHLKFEQFVDEAYKSKELDQKIELLNQAITEYEKARSWFYRTKGGMIYFQDYYEHLHNSKNPDFSYIAPVQDYLDYCLEKRDYIIPKILEVISAEDGILQKNIYQYIPDVGKSEIQQVIRDSENDNIISREKKSGTYILKIKYFS